MLTNPEAGITVEALKKEVKQERRDYDKKKDVLFQKHLDYRKNLECLLAVLIMEAEHLESRD